MHRSARNPTILTIALLCALALSAVFACAVVTAAQTSGPTALSIHGKVSGDLQPGSTTTVTVTVGHWSSADRPIGGVALKAIETDPRHSSCPTSVGGAGADFSMAPVQLSAARAPGNGTLVATGRLTMNETGVDQDACEGAKLRLTFVAF